MLVITVFSLENGYTRLAVYVTAISLTAVNSRPAAVALRCLTFFTTCCALLTSTALFLSPASNKSGRVDAVDPAARVAHGRSGRGKLLQQGNIQQFLYFFFIFVVITTYFIFRFSLSILLWGNLPLPLLPPYTLPLFACVFRLFFTSTLFLLKGLWKR